jgi:hypothetical protein
VLERDSVNIDFSTDPGFSAYVLLLMFAGIVMLVMASPTVKHSTTGLRALNALFGIGFLGYGFYLAFLFDGGGYIVFFQAFILPLLLIVRTVRGAMEARSQRVPAPVNSPALGEQTSAAPGAAPAGSEQASDFWGPPATHGEEPVKS